MTVVPAELVATAKAFSNVEWDLVLDDVVARVRDDDIVEFLESVRDAGYELFIDLCAVDYLTRDPRFEISINLVSVAQSARLRVLVGVAGTDPTMSTIIRSEKMSRLAVSPCSSRKRRRRDERTSRDCYRRFRVCR